LISEHWKNVNEGAVPVSKPRSREDESHCDHGGPDESQAMPRRTQRPDVCARGSLGDLAYARSSSTSLVEGPIRERHRMALGILFVRSPPASAAMRRIMVLVGCIGYVVGFGIFAALVPGEMISNGLLNAVPRPRARGAGLFAISTL
jgi:hypothetical protein